MQPVPLLTFLLSYLLNLKIGLYNTFIGPGEFKVFNDQNQVRRFDNGFIYKGNFNLNNAVRFRLWTRQNPFFAQEILVWDRYSLQTSNFDNRRVTKIFLHGSNHRANEKRLDKETAYLRDAYTTFADVNFVLMDWTRLAAHTGYLTNNGDIAGERLAQFVRFLNNNGMPMESIHIIGHSWGAHVAGYAGRKLGGRVGRITGIDPAGPFYTKPFNFNPKRRLDKANARFVDVIHSDAGDFLKGPVANMGLKEAIGHVDFYPAGGSTQPGCPPRTPAQAKDFYCSHERGIYYLAESIGSPFAFPSCRCESWERFTRNQCGCVRDDMSFMGEHAPRTRKGTYYLNVRPSKPYGFGPETQVILKSITRAPTFIQTETKSTLSLVPRGETKNGTGTSSNIPHKDKILVFDLPTYSSRNYARNYNDDVINTLLETLGKEG